MILRRLIEHVSAQNWTAVVLDFLIVVLGVFLGIQIGNWNDARRDRETEKTYLVRLQQELAEILPEAKAEFELIRHDYQLLDEVKNYFVTGDLRETLVTEHCSATIRSHIYADAIFYPPTIKELIATGRITLIRDNSIRAAILSFDQANETMSQLRTDIQIDRQVLSRKYPNLIRHGLSSWESAACDFQSMREDQAFLNDFTDNLRRSGGYVEDVMGRQTELLGSLSATLNSGEQAP